MAAKLTAEEVAERLDLPLRTVERWARQGRIPAARDGDSFTFDERELEPWARDHSLTIAAAPAGDDSPTAGEPVAVSDTIRRGGVYHDVPAESVEIALRHAAQLAPIADEHRPELLERLLQREELSSTGIGGGIAIPHPRTPLVGVVTTSSITVCFLDHPLDMRAIDGLAVHTLLLILSSHTKTHLRLLARLAFWLRDGAFRDLLARQPPAEELLAEVTRREAQSPLSPSR